MKLLENQDNNYILPFLWMRGEEEAVIRKEIEKIYECGIRAVCVEARPHKEFCDTGWWHDMDIVIDEAENRGMKIWILDDKHFPTGYANGLIESKYPERKKLYINYSVADVFGTSKKVTLNVKHMLKPVMRFVDFGKQFNEEERKNNKLVSLIAARLCHESVLSEDVLDLTDCVNGDWAEFQLPQGAWRVFAVYQTRTDGGSEDYINLIDKESAYTQIEGVYQSHYEKYGDKFGSVIAGFFSDEPQFGNTPGFQKEAIVGKMEMALPWSNELANILEERYGKNYRMYLPFLWNDTAEKETGVKIRYDYMDGVSLLYRENFSNTLGKWCEEHGVEYIGHVVEDDGAHSRLGLGAAHYFRAMAGQHMAGIDCIGGQIVYGAPIQSRKAFVEMGGEFYHYALGKLGSSCGHLDPMKKGRTMCELFGAYGWRFGVRDMKYILDHLLVRGVNYLVPHAFSMAEYPDPDCPPHFYARGNNPQFSYFTELMKYANRMCELLNNGTHVASVAVLYDGEADWSGEHMTMERVGRELTCNQIDFDIVCTDMLTDKEYYGTHVENGELVIHQEHFKALIIPYSQRITKELAAFIEANRELPIIFIDQLPEAIVNEDTGKQNNLTPLQAAIVVPLNKLSEQLKKAGYQDIQVDTPFEPLSFYHYVKQGHIFMFQNESVCDVFNGKITVPTDKKLVIYHGFENNMEKLTTTVENGKSVFELSLNPAQSCLVMEWEEQSELKIYEPEKNQMSENSVYMDISEGWQVSKVHQRNYPDFPESTKCNALAPISDAEPSFAGIIKYEKEITVKEKTEKATLYMEHVYEAVSVWINGKAAGTRIAPPYRVEIGEYLNEGLNHIRIEVATTLDRDQLNYPEHPFIFSHEIMEPTGMFGAIRILF